MDCRIWSVGLVVGGITRHLGCSPLLTTLDHFSALWGLISPTSMRNFNLVSRPLGTAVGGVGSGRLAEPLTGEAGHS